MFTYLSIKFAGKPAIVNGRWPIYIMSSLERTRGDL